MRLFNGYVTNIIPAKLINKKIDAGETFKRNFKSICGDYCFELVITDSISCLEFDCIVTLLDVKSGNILDVRKSTVKSVAEIKKRTQKYIKEWNHNNPLLEKSHVVEKHQD